MAAARWAARLAAPVLALAAVLGSSGVATATPADDAYFAALRAAGITWPPAAQEALIGVAHLVCYDLTWGWQPQQIADNIHAELDNKGVTLMEVGSLVNAAHSIYCPGNVCDAPTLCT
jgi:hypothetical protein